MIIELLVDRSFGLDALWERLIQADYDDQACEEIRDCWDVYLTWTSWFSERFGEITSLRHRSKPHDDPPDIEFVFADRAVILCEHTRLQPRPLGWADGLKREINSSGFVFTPSISNPPPNRKAMIDVMAGIETPWSEGTDDLAVIQNSIATAMREKMGGIPTGGLIVMRNYVPLSKPEVYALPDLIFGLLHSDKFADFDPFTLVLFERMNCRQFWSILLRRGKPPLGRRGN